jgi:hypothetical protein
MNSFRTLLSSVLLAIVACCGTSTAGLIVQHVGTADPTTEGWTAEPGGGGNVNVGSINDGGTPAWFVDDNSGADYTTFLYTHVVSSADIAVGKSLGWTLSTTLRVASDESLLYDGSPTAIYRDGVTSWQMNFGLNASGDTFVRLYTGDTTGPVHTIAGHSTYNTFSLSYDPLAPHADLFVNGTEVISDYKGFSNSQTRVLWGAGRSPDQGQGNFSELSFVAIPEPSSISICLSAGAGILIAHRLRNRRRSARNRRPYTAGS